ncbi:MAG: DUF3426 domain-containing protein [Thiohalomonadaceae bacterium]
MYTQCPACRTYFRITPEQLQAAGGKVRCGECRNVFHAPDFLTDTLPGIPADAPLPDEPDYEQLLREPAAEEPSAEAAPAPEQSDVPTESPAAEPGAPQPTAEEEAEDNLAIDLDELFGAGATAEAEFAPEAWQEEAPVAASPTTVSATYGEEDIEALLTPDATLADATPENFALPWDEPPGVEPVTTGEIPDSDAAPDTLADFDQPAESLTSAHSLDSRPALSSLSTMLATADETPPRRLLATLGWTLGSLLLIAALAVQYVYLNRLAFVQQAELRPLIEILCRYTACRLPPQRDLAALTLLERDIRSHEQYQGALTIRATLQNRAAFAQPYPAVEVVMRDLGGKVVAARRFLPKEYLAGPAPELLESQATAQLTLDVVDPGAEAVGFEFTFH